MPGSKINTPTELVVKIAYIRIQYNWTILFFFHFNENKIIGWSLAYSNAFYDRADRGVVTSVKFDGQRMSIVNRETMYHALLALSK